MDFTLSETSKGKQSLLYDGFAFRIDRVLKSGDISWPCTVKNWGLKMAAELMAA